MDTKRILVALVLAALTIGMWGSVDASETRTYDYTTATNVRAGALGPGETVVCPTECTMGGFVFDHFNADAVVVPEDKVWGANVGALYCIRWTLGGDWCKVPPELDVLPDRALSHGPVCGPTVVPLEPYPLDPTAIAYVYTLLVTEGLEVCGATDGTMTITH